MELDERTLTDWLLFVGDEYLLGEPFGRDVMDIGTVETLARPSGMLGLLIVAGVTGLVSATAALWTQGRAMVHQRVFAGLVSLAVTVILFSLIGWAAAAVVGIAPLVLTWVFVGVCALLFALRLYRELRSLPTTD